MTARWQLLKACMRLVLDLKNNRIRLTSYISPDLDDLIEEFMEENNISTKSQALERMLIEFRYMRNEVEFLRGVVGGGGMTGSFGYSRPPVGRRAASKPIDKVKTSIDDIYSNMPD